MAFGGNRKFFEVLPVPQNAALVLNGEVHNAYHFGGELDLVIVFLVYTVQFAGEKNVLNLLIHDHNCLIIYHRRTALALLMTQMRPQAGVSGAAFVWGAGPQEGGTRSPGHACFCQSDSSILAP